MKDSSATPGEANKSGAWGSGKYRTIHHFLRRRLDGAE